MNRTDPQLHATGHVDKEEVHANNHERNVLDNLQPRAVKDFVVDRQLASLVVENQHPNTTAAISECVLDLGQQAALVQNRKALLHISSLSHGDDAAVIPDVKNAVLLEHRT